MTLFPQFLKIFFPLRKFSSGGGGTPMVISRGGVTCGLSVRYCACAPVCVCVCVCVRAPEYASMFVCAPISSDGVVHKQKCMYPPATHKTKTVLKSSSEVAGSCVGFCFLPYVTADDRQTTAHNRAKVAARPIFV